MEKQVINHVRFGVYSVNIHDFVCNQKYANSFVKEGIPYSFHLRSVVEQVYKFRYLIKNDYDLGLVIAGAWGHDLIEDGRVTYNDIKQEWGVDLADIIYACTEEKGKNRNERHNVKYYLELNYNDLAVFVKLCDILANVKFSLATNSSMYDKYQSEFSKFKKYCYKEQFDDMFSHLEKILFSI